jgi:hypothetical protein
MGNRTWANTLIRHAQDLLLLAESLAPAVMDYEAWEREMGNVSTAFAAYKTRQAAAQQKAIADAVTAATKDMVKLDAADLAAIAEMNGTANPPNNGGGVTMPPPPPTA